MGIFTDHLEKFFPSKKGKKHMMKILKSIVEHDPISKQTNIFKSISEINSRLKRKSLIFIISDFISESYLQSLKVLKLHHKIVLIKISDTNERIIPDMGYTYLEDAETGNQILVNTSDKNFQKNIQRVSQNQKIRFKMK